ncbi:DUF190 domain-containing protein [Ferrimicrobium acidiphilum]|uniref:Uncharacterized protein n=1 Tax=Ferrimicrobium acidiphilum DSM 19497 TaxID=1121877 RepID=A0A0D8FX19_9ACTN|nr:DUF190 domain-containing protein [Ferrimicrobium acidiphilum]KJE77755.1 hypothetical protein FEAC_05030 [Ferrimicrobium acidiphilum DSM 19497]MCL5053299.1 DUF190 domain-containing protein [Gammaproteobacteria bacterium]
MDAELLVIFVNESDRVHHHSAVDFIIRQALDQGLAGASAFRAIDGYGIHHRLHHQTLLSMTDDEGVAIFISDTSDKLNHLVSTLSTAGVRAATLRLPVSVDHIG